MAVLYHPGLDPSRVYYGTDTRALELLVGAALAMVWPSRRLRPASPPQARRTDRRRRGSLGLVVIAADVLARRRVLARSSTAAGSSCSRSRPCSRSPRWRIRPRGSARSSAAGRCAGSASAPTGSTSGTSRSSSSPPPTGRHTAEPAHAPSLQVAAIFGDRRRSPGATSRTRSATAPWAGSGASGERAAGGGSAVPRAPGRSIGVGGLVVAIALAGLAGVGAANAPSDGSGKTVAEDGHATQAARTLDGDDPLRSGGPHRRLDLGGPGLDRILPNRSS